MTASIGYSLGIGSGIDTKALIESLAEATRAPKEAQLAKREELNAARVSSLADAAGAIDAFASALASLISGGTLFSQPSVSDTNVFTATALPGARLGALSAEVEVLQLARAQTLVSSTLASASAQVGQGELTLTTARGSFAINIDSTNDSLDGLMRAINGANAGVTASIVTEAGSARLVLKGATGAAQAFSLSVAQGEGSGIERFASAAMTEAQSAQDAIVRLDGVEVRRASNSFSDLIPGVQIDLKKASEPGALVSVGITRPTASIEQAVADFVAAYNELHSILAEATAPRGVGSPEGGPLRGDLGIREMQRQLGKLTSTVLSSAGGPSTLAEIGVSTTRTGTLALNTARLKEVLAADPEGVEALFNPSQTSSSPFAVIKNVMGKVKPGTYTLTDLVPAANGQQATGKVNGVSFISSGPNLIAPAASGALGLIIGVGGPVTGATITIDPGLAGALQGIRDALRARTGPLTGAQDRLNTEAKAIARDREALELRQEAYYNQLVKSFTAMERNVSAFKATQSYLEQQIKAWTRD